MGCSHTSRRQPGGLEQAKLGVGVGTFPFWIRLSTVLGFLILRRENVSALFQFPTTPTIGGDLLLPNLRCKYQEEAIDSQRHVRLEESARWGPLYFFSQRSLLYIYITFRFPSLQNTPSLSWDSLVGRSNHAHRPTHFPCSRFRLSCWWLLTSYRVCGLHLGCTKGNGQFLCWHLCDGKIPPFSLSPAIAWISMFSLPHHIISCMMYICNIILCI